MGRARYKTLPFAVSRSPMISVLSRDLRNSSMISAYQSGARLTGFVGFNVASL